MRYVINYIVIVLFILISFPTLICADDYMYWDSNFGPIALLSIGSQNQTREDSATTTLYTSGNAQISANNTQGGAAELSCAADTLITEYKLTFDGNGSSATGGTATAYAEYDSFLTPAVNVTYITDDNDVEVTLWVRVSNNSNEVADAGTYNATQTLTVSWVGP